MPQLLGESDVERRPIGIWFRLANEPRPRPTLGEMLEEIAAQVEDAPAVIRGVLGDKIRKETVVVLAIGYPDAFSGEERWLFIDARVPEGKTSSLMEMPLRSYEHAPADPAALIRRSGTRATRRATKRVVMFGLGALGSPFAVTLARAGVGAFDLFDGDVLRPGNVVRHAASIRLAGVTKAIATWLAMKAVAPHASADTHETTWDIGSIDAAISRADLVVDATATLGFTLLLAERCIAMARPLLWMTAQRAGEIGRIRLMRPRRDPCPQCQRPSADASLEPAVPPLSSEDTFIESGCGAPANAANPADLELISVTAAQLALRYLDGVDELANEIWVVNEPVASGNSPLATRGVHERTLQPQTSCVLCAVA
jgi:molybdopterin/thiamine biosynthesis adenylyltransferase